MDDDLLDAILDTLIPPSEDGRMPGAGALGLSAGIRQALQGADEVLTAGLAAARSAGFAALDLEQRAAVLRGIASSQPAFLDRLLPATCAAYYQHPDVLVALGLEPRPPHPKGYALEPGDLASLDRVRARGPLYREV